MKIVLPVAGKGTRLLPHSKETPKPLFMLVGKTILDYLMDDLIKLNPSEFVFITGYLADQIELYLKTNYVGFPIRCIRQDEQLGLGHAVYCAKEAFSEDEDMLVVLGDQVFEMDWDQLLGSGHNGISLVQVEDPTRFGIVSRDEAGFVVDMEEKPTHPKTNLAISGTYYFCSSQEVFETIECQMNSNLKTHNEIQITDTMKMMIKEGKKFYSFLITEWNDCGNHKDLLLANEGLLNRVKCYHRKYVGSTIVDPVWISDDAELYNSHIGPKVSIGKAVHLENVSIENTVICDNTTIKNAIIKDSYIGANLQLENLHGSKFYLS